MDSHTHCWHYKDNREVTTFEDNGVIHTQIYPVYNCCWCNEIKVENSPVPPFEHGIYKTESKDK